MKIEPVAFLVIREGTTRVLPVAMPPMTTLDRVVEMMPDLVDKVEKYFDKKEEKRTRLNGVYYHHQTNEVMAFANPAPAACRFGDRSGGPVQSFFPCQTHAVSTSASSAILMDVDSGRVLYEQNADAKMLIASTTKILTALVAIREGDLNDVVTVSREAAYTEGSSMYLKVGEKLTLETLLYGLLLCSGNDGPWPLPSTSAAARRTLQKLMNATAREIGMEHSSFANP